MKKNENWMIEKIKKTKICLWFTSPLTQTGPVWSPINDHYMHIGLGGGFAISWNDWLPIDSCGVLLNFGVTSDWIVNVNSGLFGSSVKPSGLA